MSLIKYSSGHHVKTQIGWLYGYKGICYGFQPTLLSAIWKSLEIHHKVLVFTPVVFNILSHDNLEEDMAGPHTKFMDDLNKRGIVDRFDDRIRIQIAVTDQSVGSKPTIYNLRVIESLLNVKKKKSQLCKYMFWEPVWQWLSQKRSEG